MCMKVKKFNRNEIHLFEKKIDNSAFISNLHKFSYFIYNIIITRVCDILYVNPLKYQAAASSLGGRDVRKLERSLGAMVPGAAPGGSSI